MSALLNRILAILIFTIFIPLNLRGQDDYARHSEIMSQANELFGDKKVDEALSLLRQNKEVFQYDEMTMFLYDWLNGVILYQTDKYSEARPFVGDAIAFLDANENELADPSIISFLQIYYYAPNIDYKLGANTEVVIRELERAKKIYEVANATEDPVYSWITSGLNALKNSNIDVVATEVQKTGDGWAQESDKAYKFYLAGRYEEAIAITKDIIQTMSTQQAPLQDIAMWKRFLGECYRSIGKAGEAEKQCLEALEMLSVPEYVNSDQVRKLNNALATLYLEMHNLNKANEICQRAKIAYEENLDFGDGYIMCLSTWAVIQSDLGYNTVAKMLIDVAMRQAALNLNDKNNYTTEEEYIFFRIDPYVTYLNNAFQIYQKLGYYSDAIKVIKQAIKLAEEHGLREPFLYGNLAHLYFIKSKYPKAAELSHKSYDLSRTPYEIDESGMNFALGLFLSKNPASAEFCAEFSEIIHGHLHDMFTFMNSSERANYWERFNNYHPMLNMMIFESKKQDYFGAVYDNILESKGLLLRSTNAIRDAILSSGNPNDIDDYTRLGQLRQQLLTEIDANVRKEIKQEVESLDKRLTQRVAAYSDFAKGNSLTWLDVKAALTGKDVAIEFVNIPEPCGLDSFPTIQLEPRYCAVVLKKGYDSPRIIPICKERS